ncbi:MAG: efflux RND transporter periplasmic adaptor subunit, partial [Victivallales bacterium]|nr:efflux RND transporter periplasmic adaptor subunit [Victivallales bacterium]
KARLELERAEDELELARRQANYENLAIRRRYERHKQWVAKLEKRLEYRQKQVDNHTICAPVDGLLCYNKVYSNGKIAKVAVGSTVGPRFNVLSIPDLSAMEMRVEVNEKYYSFVKEGRKVEVRLPSLTEQTLDGEVTGVDLLFSNKGKKDSQIGLYSSHEPLGEVIFRARIRIRQGNVELKPGLLGEVIFPFRR